MSFRDRVRGWRFLRPFTLYQYVAVEYLKAMGLALTVCTLIGLLLTFVGKAAELEEFGVSVGQMALLTPYFLPQAMSYAIPLSSMIAAILVIGRMNSENEVLAAQAGGASIFLLAVPALFCGLLLSLISTWCLGVGIDWGYTTIREEILNIRKPLVQNMLKEPGTAINLELGGGSTLHVNMLEYETAASGELKRPLHVAIAKGDRVAQSLYAGHYLFDLPEPEIIGGNKIQHLNLILEKGQSLGDDPKFFNELEIEMDLPGLSAEQLSLGKSRGTVSFLTNYYEARKLRASVPKRRDFVLNRAGDFVAAAQGGSPADPTAQLSAVGNWVETKRSSEATGVAWGKIQKEMVEFHRKLALSLLPFCLIFLGVALGLLVRKGHRLIGFILGIASFAFLYYPLMVIFKEAANSRVIPSFLLWAPNLILMAAGLWIWRMHERGQAVAFLTRIANPTLPESFKKALWEAHGPFRHFVSNSLPFFRNRADRHMAASFITPLLAVCLGVASLYVAFDLIEHGTEVINGIANASDPLEGLPARSALVAVWDAMAFYLIRCVSMLLELMPALLLIAGVIAVTIMVRNNEHLIFKCSGTSLQRAFKPLVLVVLIISLGIAIFRELALPSLIMEKDRLKPLVYSRRPKGQSMAGQTIDAKDRPVVYETALYSRNLHACQDLRIYLPSEAVDGRIPAIVADLAVWNGGKGRWDLYTQDDFGPETHTTVDGKERNYHPWGHFVHSVHSPTVDDPNRYHIEYDQLEHWEGAMTPSFLDSERYGPAVMRLTELWAVSHRAMFRSEIWRRLSEPLTGLLLLLVAVPLLVKQEIGSPLLGIAMCIIIGAVYLGLLMGIAETSRSGALPSMMPLAPHVLFFVLGYWRYQYRMQT